MSEFPTIKTDEPVGQVRLEFPFDGYAFGFAVFTHPNGTFELCMVDASSTQILMSIAACDTIEQIQEEYKHFIDTFAVAMRKIDWTL